MIGRVLLSKSCWCSMHCHAPKVYTAHAANKLLTAPFTWKKLEPFPWIKKSRSFWHGHALPHILHLFQHFHDLRVDELWEADWWFRPQSKRGAQLQHRTGSEGHHQCHDYVIYNPWHHGTQAPQASQVLVPVKIWYLLVLPHSPHLKSWLHGTTKLWALLVFEEVYSMTPARFHIDRLLKLVG